MEQFTEAFGQRIGEEDLRKIEQLLASLPERSDKWTDVRALSPVAKLPFKIYDLLQIGLRRSLELGDASVRELNRENVTTSMVLVRSLFETTCLLFDAARRVAAVTDENDVSKLDELDKFLMDVLFGFKSKELGFSEEYTARNVLTIIQRITKQIGVDLMGFYEGLSEHAHPNYLGMMSVYRQPAEVGNPVVRFCDGPSEARDASLKTAISGLAIALEMLEMTMNQHAKSKGQFAALCERQIYEAGTWPQGIEYPVGH